MRIIEARQGSACCLLTIGKLSLNNLNIQSRFDIRSDFALDCSRHDVSLAFSSLAPLFTPAFSAVRTVKAKQDPALVCRPSTASSAHDSHSESSSDEADSADYEEIDDPVDHFAAHGAKTRQPARASIVPPSLPTTASATASVTASALASASNQTPGKHQKLSTIVSAKRLQQNHEDLYMMIQPMGASTGSTGKSTAQEAQEDIYMTVQTTKHQSIFPSDLQ